MRSKLFVPVIFLIALFTTPLLAGGDPPATTAKRYGAWGIDLEGMDTSVKPGDDFFRYANGKWAATTQIPPDRTRFGAFDMLRDLSEVRVRAILDRWAAEKNLKASSDEAKVAAFYGPSSTRRPPRSSMRNRSSRISTPSGKPRRMATSRS